MTKGESSRLFQLPTETCPSHLITEKSNEPGTRHQGPGGGHPRYDPCAPQTPARCLKNKAPDVIFMDLVMPLIDGKTLLRVLRHMEILRNAYVVVLSATVAEEEQNFVQMGANACIAKGSLDALAHNVLWVLDHPDEAQSRCRTGHVIGIDEVYKRCITGELLTANARLKRMLQTLTEGILETVNGNVVYANNKALELIQKNEEAVLGGPFSLLFGEKHRRDLEQILNGQHDGTAAGAKQFPLTLNNQRLLLSRLPMGDKRNDVIVIINDVTEEMKAKEMILRQQKAVVEEERLRVLLQMAGATAHELSQPLTTLLGHVELLMNDPQLPESVANRLEKIQASGKRISTIVRKIRTMRRYQTMAYADGATIVDLGQKTNLLLIHDSGKAYALIEKTLEGEKPIQLYRAKTMSDALAILAHEDIDLILTDYDLGDGNALEFIETLKEQEGEPPVVVISRTKDELTATRVIQAGAADYLPINVIAPEVLYRAVSKALQKAQLNTELKEATKKLTEMATVDDLTGLFNRRYAMEALAQEMERTRRYHTPLAICMMDLDHFKEVNDQHGHAAGDAVLSKIGEFLKEGKRQSDIVCRYGGEEFLLILPNTERKGAIQLCERLRERVAEHHFELEGGTTRITISIGLSQYNENTDQSLGELLKRADNALYRAKEAGRNRVTWVPS
ncbi:MAG: diguanylate cyclase [Deltaproteobacteria bacterium]